MIWPLVILFIIWFPVEAFIWNNLWRGRADHAELYHDYASILLTLWFTIPIISSIIVFFNRSIWSALITFGIYIGLTLIVSEWRYLIVFRQYKKLHIADLQQKGQLTYYSDEEINTFIKYWLYSNVKQP